MKKIILLLLCFFPVLSYAESKISKVTFMRQNDIVVIGYHLGAYKLNNVRVYMNSGSSTVELIHVKGDVGNVRGSGYKEIVFDIVAEFGDKAIPEDMSFTVRGKEVKYVPLYGAFEYNYSYSGPIGMGVAYFAKWGGYFRYRFSFLGSEIGDADVGYYAPQDVKHRYFRRAFTAGVVRMVYDNVIWVYGGLGYGAYAPVDKISTLSEYGDYYNHDYYWAAPKVTGLELEIGLMFNLKGFFLSVGYGSIAGEKMPFLPNVNVGAGYVLEF